MDLLLLCARAGSVFQSDFCLVAPPDPNSPGSSVRGDSPDKNSGVGSLSLLQGNFPTQELNQGLLHCRLILYQLSCLGKVTYLELKEVVTHCIIKLAPFSPFHGAMEVQLFRDPGQQRMLFPVGLSWSQGRVRQGGCRGHL